MLSQYMYQILHSAMLSKSLWNIAQCHMSQSMCVKYCTIPCLNPSEILHSAMSESLCEILHNAMLSERLWEILRKPELSQYVWEILRKAVLSQYLCEILPLLSWCCLNSCVKLIFWVLQRVQDRVVSISILDRDVFIWLSETIFFAGRNMAAGRIHRGPPLELPDESLPAFMIRCMKKFESQTCVVSCHVKLFRTSYYTYCAMYDMCELFGAKGITIRSIKFIVLLVKIRQNTI